MAENRRANLLKLLDTSPLKRWGILGSRTWTYSRSSLTPSRGLDLHASCSWGKPPRPHWLPSLSSRVPHGTQSLYEDISGGIFISVENAAAFTNMGSSRKRFLDPFAAFRAILASVCRGNNYGNFAKNLGEVFEPHPELIPASITNGWQVCDLKLLCMTAPRLTAVKTAVPMA